MKNSFSILICIIITQSSYSQITLNDIFRIKSDSIYKDTMDNSYDSELRIEENHFALDLCWYTGISNERGFVSKGSKFCDPEVFLGRITRDSTGSIKDASLQNKSLTIHYEYVNYDNGNLKAIRLVFVDKHWILWYNYYGELISASTYILNKRFFQDGYDIEYDDGVEVKRSLYDYGQLLYCVEPNLSNKKKDVSIEFNENRFSLELSYFVKETFYPDGTIKSKGKYYPNGNLHEGNTIKYNKKGKILEEGDYIIVSKGKFEYRNIKTGTWKKYDGKGKLIEVLTFDDKGTCIKLEKK